MGFLADIRSGKRDRDGLGGYAIIFWLIAGLGVGCGLGASVGVGTDMALLPFALFGLMSGCCIGFYAAFGKTSLARFLALPGILLGAIETLVGL
jgi:hypothetical protein